MNEGQTAKRSSTGLETGIASLLCYLLGWITGIIFLIIEREDQVVRFHAAQSLVAFGLLTLISIGLSIFAVVPGIGLIMAPLSLLISLFGLGLWIFLLVKAISGQKYVLPLVGSTAENIAKGSSP